MLENYNSCVDCGEIISKPYRRCYSCNRTNKIEGWHEPEVLPELEEVDYRKGTSKFYVYVLDTHYGH